MERCGLVAERGYENHCIDRTPWRGGDGEDCGEASIPLSAPDLRFGSVIVKCDQ